MRTSRRNFLLTATSAAAAGAALTHPLTRPAWGREFGADAPPQRYPDPDVIVLDERFRKLRISNTPIQRIHTGNLWAEGPAWNAVGRYLLWSDIPNDRQCRWLQEDNHVSVIRQPAQYSNGNTFDYQGRLVSFEHGTRQVVRHEHDGSVTVLADKFNGKPFNAPNDGVVHPDGSVWFTDPGYGALLNYEGNKGETFLKEAVYRIDPNGRVDMVSDEFVQPNGICFSPDYKKLYVTETGAFLKPDTPKLVKEFDVIDGKKLSSARLFTSMAMEMGGEEKAGLADGIRADEAGNIWVSAGWVGEGYDGVHVFTPEGQRIGLILLPEICTNVCFGGPKRNRLFMTASQSVYAIYVETRGAHIT